MSVVIADTQGHLVSVVIADTKGHLCGYSGHSGTFSVCRL